MCLRLSQDEGSTGPDRFANRRRVGVVEQEKLIRLLYIIYIQIEKEGQEINPVPL
jgi:hypothetical protein